MTVPRTRQLLVLGLLAFWTLACLVVAHLLA